ncbi:hypothetical protein V2J09_023677 [Rumex salicifolius]
MEFYKTNFLDGITRARNQLMGQRRFSASSDDVNYHILPNSSLIKFSFKELKAATRNFKPDTLVCNGCIGDVFKGWLNLDEKQQPIAIKRLYLRSVQDLEKMLTEIRFLGTLSHPNLVEFLGYCFEDSWFFLVYEYAKRGSLENHLFGSSRVQPLSWELRIKIAVGAARGIPFLGKSDDLNDVYSFGVVLVELLTGSRASDLTHSDATFDRCEWVKPYLLGKRSFISIMDSRLGNYPKRAAIETAKIALNCLAVDPNDRPSMEEVLETL